MKFTAKQLVKIIDEPQDESSMKFTIEQLAKFIHDQPDEREVNMCQVKSTDNPGCLLKQFGESLGFSNFGCSFNRLYVDDVIPTKFILEPPVGSGFYVAQFISKMVDLRITTFGQAKEHLSLIV